MSLKCMETECKQIATKECNCKIPTRYCKDHMKVHGDSFKCYKKSIQDRIDAEMEKVKQAKFTLRKVKQNLIEFSEKLVKIIVSTLSQRISEIETQIDHLDKWIIEEHQISLNEYISNFEYPNILQRSTEAFTKDTNLLLSINPQNENMLYDCQYKYKNPLEETKYTKLKSSRSKLKIAEPRIANEIKTEQKDYESPSYKTQSYASTKELATSPRNEDQGVIPSKKMTNETSKKAPVSKVQSKKKS